MVFHQKLYFVAALLAVIPQMVTGKQNCIDLNVGPALNRKRTNTSFSLCAPLNVRVDCLAYFTIFSCFIVIVFKQPSKQLNTVNFHVLIFDTTIAFYDGLQVIHKE